MLKNDSEVSKMRNYDLLMLTVVPSNKERLRPEPPGIVNPLRLIILHLTAAEMSLRELMVPVQA